MIGADDLSSSTVPPATPQRKNPSSCPSEAWEDAFVFRNTDEEARILSMHDTSLKHEKKTKSRLECVEEAEAGSPRTPQRNVAEGLRAWSESPTSPRDRGALGPRRVGRQEERENWDDDFLDSTDSPARPTTLTPAGPQSRTAQRIRVPGDLEEENWDEDFKMAVGINSPDAGPSVRSKRSRREREGDAAWDSSDDEAEIFGREMGLDRNDEEDKTVTSRSRRKPLGSLANEVAPLPLLPPLPTFLSTIPSDNVSGSYASLPSPFPRSSPNHSVFSIPATMTSGGQRDRDSTYGSTAHLALSLRRTHSAESSSSSPRHRKFIDPSRFPHSPEAPRERRRLRKKSRPPHLDSSILELDDKALGEPTFFRPSTPESRPSTPPPSSSTGLVLSPTTPSSSVQNSSAVPLSPTSAGKSPLLTRIGSMRRWGRKRVGAGASIDVRAPEDPDKTTGNPSTSEGPPSSFATRILDAEADRLDNNRTPRPCSHVAYQSPPLSAMPPPPAPTNNNTTNVGHPQMPNQNRFFRGSLGGLDAGTSVYGCSGLAMEVKDVNRAKSKEREREQLRVAIPKVVPMTTQSSQSGESEVGIAASPRRARIRAFGHKLLSSKRSASASSPERPIGSSEGDSSRMSTHGYGHRQVSTPLSGETPTRPRPRIPGSYQGASSFGKTRTIFPRHVSGSAVNSDPSQGAATTSMSVCGRSVSASGSTGTAASSDDPAHSDKGLDEKGGHRGFMGSLRRISIASAHAQQCQQHGAGSHCHPQSPVPVVPPLPGNALEPSLSASPVQEAEAQRACQSDMSGAIQVDLALPTSGPQRDWLSSGPPRRSADLPVLTHSKSSSFATSSSGQNATASRLNTASQVASLGRASPLPIGSGASANGSANVLRRNSLGDLKIPSRISRAQDGLKRDLGRVREFAGRVEQMQELRASYLMIASEIQTILDAPRPPSRATSPTGSLFGLSRSNSRARSNTNPPPPPCIDYKGLGRGFRAIDAKYSIAWECADLLIELGTGNVVEPSAQPTSASNQNDRDTIGGRGKNRERAVTLAGDEGKPDLSLTGDSSSKSPAVGSPPALLSWRATSGRQDLGHRQLYLLKEMLNNAESAKEGAQLDIPDIPHWLVADDAMDSSLTLPTEESVMTNPRPGSPTKKNRTSRLVGIRDMLRSLKRSTARALQNQPEGKVIHSSTTVGTESSFDIHPRQPENHPYSYNTISGVPTYPANTRRKSEANAAPADSMRSPAPDYGPFTGKLPVSHKSSPRRPSLASLFRLGQKHKAATTSSSTDSPEQRGGEVDAIIDILGSSGQEQDHTRPDTSQHFADDNIEDSDWDRMDSMSDVDAQMAAIADGCSGRSHTVKLRKKKQQNRLSMPPQPSPSTLRHYGLPFSSSQGSFATPDQSLTNIRSPRLSNVDENNVSMPSAGRRTPEIIHRRYSRAGKGRERDKQFSSVRTVPPKLSMAITSFDAPPAPNLKLAMTPENIKPLLENARVVTARLHDCLAEVKGLLVRTESSAFTLSSSASSSKVAL